MSREEIRQRAAIAVLPECVRTCNEVLLRGGKLTEETQAKQAAMMAVAYADELAEKLSSVEQNGKECKPANLSKSSKDLQALINEEIKRRCEGIDVDEMFDIVPPRIFKTDFDFYKKGVVDTINKLKGK